MPIELKMPALSPTMEEGTLAKWLVKEGDEVKSGDILAEIETDKATMEFEAVDEGKIAKILVPEGTDGVKVGAPIAILAGEGEDVSAAAAPKADTAPPATPKAAAPPKPDATPKAAGRPRLRSKLPRRQASLPPRAAKGIASRLPRSRAAWPKRRASIFQPFRAAAPAAASSAPILTRRPARRPLPALRPVRPRPRPPAISSRPGPSSRRSRTKRSSCRTSARPLRGG